MRRATPAVAAASAPMIANTGCFVSASVFSQSCWAAARRLKRSAAAVHARRAVVLGTIFPATAQIEEAFMVVKSPRVGTS